MSNPMPARISRLLTAIALGLLVRTGYAETPDTSPAPEPPRSGIEQIAWQLVGYRTEGDFIPIPPDAKPAYFRFESGRLSGNTGCNQVMGAYRASGEGLAFDQGMAMTRKACAKSLMLQERAVLVALDQVVSYRIEGERLLMLDAEGNPLLELHAASRSPLVGPVWQLEDSSDGTGALAASVKGARIDLSFLANGVLGGTDGCNRYMSGYVEDAGKLTIGPLATSRLRCRDGDERDTHADAYGAVLGKVAGFSLQHQRLTLLSRDGSPLAHYRALEPTPLAKAIKD